MSFKKKTTRYFKPVGRQVVKETQQVPQAGKGLQRELMAIFVKDNQNKFSEIVEALSAEDVKTVHSLAHTLKNAAAQLKKPLLKQAAADIEHQLKDGKNLVTPQQIATLEMELDAALAEFASLLCEPVQSKAAAQTEPIDTEFARDSLENFEPMLEMANPARWKFINSLCLIPESEELIQQMEDWNFQPDIATLTGWKDYAYC